MKNARNDENNGVFAKENFDHLPDDLCVKF